MIQQPSLDAAAILTEMTTPLTLVVQQWEQLTLSSRTALSRWCRGRIFVEGPAGTETEEVHTEVRNLNMTSISLSHPHCAGIPGTAVRAGIAASGQPISPGEVESTHASGAGFPGESFFNVFVEVDLPMLGGFSGGTLYNTDPLLVINDNLTAFPPQVVYVHDNTNAVPILMLADDPSGMNRWLAGDVFGWLVLAGHGIDFDCNKPDDVERFQAIISDLPEMPLPASAAFPGSPEDDNTRSIGSFRIFVAEEYRSLMENYPGYNASDHRLQSGYLYDPGTVIGQRRVHALLL